MVTAKTGILTSAGGGDGTTSTAAQRTLVDFKDAIVDYRVTSLPILQMFAQKYTTETGGDIDITVAKQSMAMEQIDEGSTPAYQSTDLRNERVSVKEYGLAVGVTRRMIEDSRFSEMEMALNEARRAVDRHITGHAVKALFGITDSIFGTTDVVVATTEANAQLFANFDHGTFFGNDVATAAASGSRLNDYGLYDATAYNAMGPNTGSHYLASTGVGSASVANFSLLDLTRAIELIGSKGGNADTIMISPSHYKLLLDLADFTTPFSTVAANGSNFQVDKFGGSDSLGMASAAQTGLVGQLYGLKVFVNSYVPVTKFGVFDMSVKPMAYVERRGLTVEEANPGFGITGSYMSMRYGMKIIRPESGVIVIATAD
tara:strand:- start:760 stop:1878 length:1119 start_codon:yes stop_codon:yes gene_type:complete